MDDRVTCPHCRREGLRVTEKGLVFPHFSNKNVLCPPEPAYPPATPPPRKGKKRRQDEE